MTELVTASGITIVDRRTACTLDLVEYRDPKAATQRTGFTSPHLAQVEEWDAAQAFRLGVMANVIAYRCVQIRAGAGAKIPLVAGRRHGDYTTVNDNAPIARLLGPPPGGPAPRLSARKLLRWTLAQEIVTGRRAWEIETDDGTSDGRPVAFWPLSAAHLRAHPSKSGTEWFRLFEYGPAHNPVRLSPDQVFYGWDPSGTDFRQAESALQVARYDLSLVNLCDRYGIGFLRNNATPATIITTTAFPDEASKRAFMRAWQHEYGGPDNAGRVALNEVSDDPGVDQGPVGDLIDVKQLGISAKDARLVEQRKEAMAELAIALGVPWSKLDASGRTFDNADAEEKTFYEETVLPDLDDLQDDINMQLAPRLGDEVVWFDLRTVDALKRRLFPTGLNAAEMLDRGAVLINEIRTTDLELEPVDWGDAPLDAAADTSNITVVREYAEMLQKIYLAVGVVITAEEARDLINRAGGDLPALSAEVLSELGKGDPTDDDDRTPPAVEDREPIVEDRGPTVEEIEERRTRIWRATDALATQIETRWERAVRRLFARQLDATVSRLTGKRGRQAFGDIEQRVDPLAEAIFDVEFWTAESEREFIALYEQVTGAALDRLASMFEISFDFEVPWVREFIETRANQLAGQVTTTTYEAITDQLAAGVAEGESIDALADRIRHVFTVADETRATTIARTEVISAFNGASTAGVENLPGGIIAAHEWIATRDGRTRDDHAAADGQVQLLGDPFNVAGVAMAYPGDPAADPEQVVNCRCTVGFLTPAEFVALDRSPRHVDHRLARSLLTLVPFGDEFDVLGFRRALEVSTS